MSEYIIRTRWDEPRIFASKRLTHWFIHGTNERFYGTPVEIECVDGLIDGSKTPPDTTKGR